MEWKEFEHSKVKIGEGEDFKHAHDVIVLWDHRFPSQGRFLPLQDWQPGDGHALSGGGGQVYHGHHIQGCDHFVSLGDDCSHQTFISICNSPDQVEPSFTLEIEVYCSVPVEDSASKPSTPIKMLKRLKHKVILKVKHCQC